MQIVSFPVKSIRDHRHTYNADQGNKKPHSFIGKQEARI